jgi:hypothetical protein
MWQTPTVGEMQLPKYKQDKRSVSRSYSEESELRLWPDAGDEM